MTDPVTDPVPDEPVPDESVPDETVIAPTVPGGSGSNGHALTRRISVPLLVLGLLMAGGISYCSVSGFSTTSGVSPCFTALPVARAAIRVKATFVGVQRLGIKDLQEDFRILSQQMPDLGKKPACVVAYRGTFLPADVVDPRPSNQGGKIALVIVPDRAKVAVATLLRDRVPAHFRQLFARGPHR